MVCARPGSVAFALCWALLSWCAPGIADPLPTVGQLYLVDPATAAPYEDALRAGLRELGYVEGRNIAIVSRYGHGDATRLPQLLEELIQMKVDILFVSPRIVELAKARTTTIPIICPSLGNPVEEGLVASMVRPGGNLTGVSTPASELDEKRLELMLETMSELKRLGMLVDPDQSGQARATEQYRALAHRLGIELVVMEARNADEV